MLLSDLRHDFVRTLSGELMKISPTQIDDLYKAMTAEALRTLAEEGMRGSNTTLRYAVDLKYVGQFHEVTVPFARLPVDFTELQERFDAQHRKLYGYNLPGQAVEALHWRLTAIGATERPSFGRAVSPRNTDTRPKKNREVIFNGRKVTTGVYQGAQLQSQQTIDGPAIVEEPTTTIVVPPGWRLAVNEFGDYELSL